jgi:2-oxoglutarate ferredoxin oxidoreductase subunit beta
MENDGHDPANRMAAFEKALEWGDRIPTGVFYKRDSEPFESKLDVLKSGPLTGKQYDSAKLDSVFENFS